MTTTTTNQRLQELRDELESDKVLLAQAKAIEIPPSLVQESHASTSPFNTTLFAAILTGLGGLIVGIAIGTTYIAPTL